MKLPSQPEIKAFFPDFRAPVRDNFLLLIYCVLSARSLSLYKCAEYVPGEAHPRSKYRRLLRFIGMKHATLFCHGVARLLLSMAPASSTLVMDRTNWKRGESPINLLCLGLLIHDRFYLPLLCKSLQKNGASSELERIALMKQFMKVHGSANGFTLLADREFVGRIWFGWLRRRGLKLVIRLREKDYFESVCSQSEELDSRSSFKRQVHRKGAVSIPFKLEGYWFYYTGLISRTIGGDVFYLLSSYPLAHDSAERYRKRWSIEVFFKQLKTAGFQLESTGLSKPERLQMLMAVASVAYMTVLDEGLARAEQEPIQSKQSSSWLRSWPAVSMFRYGLQVLVSRIRTLEQFGDWISRLFRGKMGGENALLFSG